MNLKKDIANIIEWFHFALNMLSDMIKKQDYANAMILVDDIRYVILSYFQAIASFAPDEVTPFPKNFFSQVSWIGKNINWLRIITGDNPFELSAKKAKDVAAKWGFRVSK